MHAYERLARWYRWVTWFGMLLNMLFIVPLLFAPQFAFRVLRIEVEPDIWARIAGLFLFIITIFYIPASVDLRRFRVFAWLAILPSRAFGTVFFLLAVVLFEYPLSYLSGAILDGSIVLAQLVILLNVLRVENHRTVFKCVLGTAIVLGILVLGVGAGGWYTLLREVPQQLQDDTMEEYFKYGSIGTEKEFGIPYWLWLVLPRMFPEYLPGPGGYPSLGILWEPGRDMPIGFSKKRIGFDRVGINCALCHTASVRLSPDQPVPTLYLAGPAHTFDALAYQRFLFACASDKRFTPGNVMSEIARITTLSWGKRLLYRYLLIPSTQKALLQQKAQFAWTDSRPDWGRGRIDPFNPVKVRFLGVSVGQTIGNSDMVPIWNLRPRQGMAYHWDGLNTDLTEVVRSSALGDGASLTSIPLAALDRLQQWLLDVPAPPYPLRHTVNAELQAVGAQIYAQYCADCHAFGGKQTGHVLALAESGTDPHRAMMWTPQAADAYNTYTRRYPWDFMYFRAPGGYVNVPLDAVWIRAPYLHNGSVPSLTDLLQPPAQRPQLFYRGYDVYDPEKMGFVSSGPEAERYGFRYDTHEPGNSNAGHVWGTDLSPEEKKALIEFLKTL